MNRKNKHDSSNNINLIGKKRSLESETNEKRENGLIKKNLEPNYDSILCNQNKVYVKYSNDFNKDFKHYKINSTRKYIYNSSSIMNNPGTNYNIVNVLNKHKEMEQKKNRR